MITFRYLAICGLVTSGAVWAQTAVPPSGPTPEWSFINYSEISTPPKLFVECDFRDTKDKLYNLVLEQNGGTVYVVGGFEAWKDRSERTIRELPKQTRIIHDDTGLFANADLPRFDEWSEPVTTKDKWHTFELKTENFMLPQREELPTVVTAFRIPPPAPSITRSGKVIQSAEEAPERPLALAGFCKITEEINIFTFNELNKLGLQAQ
ncbi:hypothetical protein [Erythrobacter litoralis]|uniref:hypothetical protein n=1 Tax=Erythrobacter litoralis TaxID=39960 RepID=UPI002435A1AA|nr:hypothetical protein [Erythrobacter litoralis]